MLKNEFQVIRHIYQDKGMLGFYSGSTPNFYRMLLKNVYRYPLMITLPGFFQQNMPMLKDKWFAKFLTGTSIALVESLILCPFERFKVLFMTQSSSSRLGYLGYLKLYKNQLRGELFKGLTPLTARQAIAWISFLEADLMIKQLIKNQYSIKIDEVIPTRYLLVGSFAVALINTMCVMPFDAVKSFFQKIDPIANWSDAIKYIYKEAGIKGFFVGWRLRYSMYLLHAVFTVDLLEKLEHWSNQLYKNE
ncbi:UNKNOWN [Stylonychia lemnae]|uniref:Mitochondrial carrier protein n=1 Tax=Stylonychia lemnae TaxID=5949 RepID=A0A078ABL9_STYLE|nr:UNKNOWN [Stylonychia lemnae]|eukprot:CDW78178.1 UNKNOWN [Stylonychia lemnae]